jgi:CBS domain-containing protein
MPSSYQAPTRGDKEHKTTMSQSEQSNFSSGWSTVQRLLDRKGAEVYSIHPDDTLADAVSILRDKRIGAVIVTDAREALAGILSERDIVRKLAETPGRTLPQRVADVMTSSVEVCTPEETLVSVLKRMTEGRFRHMPVVAEQTVVGIVTIGDVVNFRLRELEHEALQLKQMIVG